jgi:hypothetical protein
MPTYIFSILLALTVSVDQLSDAFNKGNSAKIAEHFNDNIELIIDNSEKMHSKSQAEQILNRFFSKNAVVSYKKIHEGKKDDTLFVVGQLITKNGKYRVSYLLKEKNSVVKIHQLRIEADD